MIEIRGTHPQSDCKHAEEMAKTTASWGSGACWLLWELATSPSLLMPRTYFSVIGVHFPCYPYRPLDFPGATPLGAVTPSFCIVSVWRASNTSCNWLSSKSQTFLVSSIPDIDIMAIHSPSSKLGTLGRGRTLTPYPGYVFGCLMGDWSSQQYILLPAYPSEVGHRVYQVCPPRLCLHWDGMLWHHIGFTPEPWNCLSVW